MDQTVWRHLRTKILHVPEQAAEAGTQSGEADISRHCWCDKTMMPLGIGDRWVGIELCSDPARTCYRPG
jgi:hypothetical protein